MRHIPDEEVHAYLDQALSRSQCIEIETHLAGCAPCQRQRDGAAALRDRTTAILAQGTVRRVHPPPFPALVERAGARRQAGWRRRAVWAASLTGALLAGWGMRALLDPHAPASAPVVAASAPTPESVPPSPIEPPLSRPTPAPVSTASGRDAAWSNPSLRLVSGRGTERPPDPPPAGTDSEAAENWPVVSPPQAAEATGNLVATITALAVESIRMLRLTDAERPVLLVAQRHPSGDLVFTVEGPVAEVANLVSAHLRRGWNSSEPSRSLPDYVDDGGTVRRTSRVVAVVGKLPADSLNALAQGVVMR